MSDARRLGVAAAAGAARGGARGLRDDPHVRPGARRRRPRAAPRRGPASPHRPGPDPGADAGGIVLGFLQSNADFVNDHEVARKYLTASGPPAVAAAGGHRGLRPGGRAARGAALRRRHRRRPSTGAEVGRIDADGSFVRSAPDRDGDPRLRPAAGRRRVADRPARRRPAAAAAPRWGRPTGSSSLYFLGPSGHTLVPDTVLLPGVPGLTTKLVARLLRGPTASLRGAVTTAFPPGTGAGGQLGRGARRARDRPAGQLGPARPTTTHASRCRRRSSGRSSSCPRCSRCASPPAVDSPLLPGVSEEVNHDPWPTYDPDDLPASPSAYVVPRPAGSGATWTGRFEPVPGAGGTGPIDLRLPGACRWTRPGWRR